MVPLLLSGEMAKPYRTPIGKLESQTVNIPKIVLNITALKPRLLADGTIYHAGVRCLVTSFVSGNTVSQEPVRLEPLRVRV
jgi:hypothetical protein